MNCKTVFENCLWYNAIDKVSKSATREEIFSRLEELLPLDIGGHIYVRCWPYFRSL